MVNVNSGGYARPWCGWLIAVSFLGSLGCGDGSLPAADEPAEPSPNAASRFDPTTTATVCGQVSWQGKVPVVEPYHATIFAGDGSLRAKLVEDNPHAPQVDPRSKGVGNAVVFLRGIDCQRARPWDLPSVEVEQRDYHLQVRQGGQTSPYGFVRRGEPISMVSRQPVLHSLHVRGAAFFALMFPDPDQPCTRRLREAGLVELSSGAGYYWMRGYLFVDDHPYYARTDAAGRFQLPQVPAGRYEVVCWIPNWLEEHHDRDPESGQVSRMTFRPPLEQVQPVVVEPGQTRTLSFTVSADLFPR